MWWTNLTQSHYVAMTYNNNIYIVKHEHTAALALLLVLGVNVELFGPLYVYALVEPLPVHSVE